MDEIEKPDESRALPVPPYVVLYRNQSEGEVVPQIDAMFRDLRAAHRYLNMYRPLQECEFLTLEEIDRVDGVATVHSSITAGTMRMVITDAGPRAVPKELASLWGGGCTDPDCDCHEEDDDE